MEVRLLFHGRIGATFCGAWGHRPSPRKRRLVIRVRMGRRPRSGTRRFAGSRHTHSHPGCATHTAKLGTQEADGLCSFLLSPSLSSHCSTRTRAAFLRGIRSLKEMGGLEVLRMPSLRHGARAQGAPSADWSTLCAGRCSSSGGEGTHSHSGTPSPCGQRAR